MHPKRWLEVERLYHLAQRMNARQRVGFLDQVCGGDVALRQEILSLLECTEGAEEQIRADVGRAAAELANEGRAFRLQYQPHEN